MARTVPGAAARRMLVLAALALFALAAAPAAAQPLGIPQQVSFTEPIGDLNADSTESAIAYGGGRSLVVWQQISPVVTRGRAKFTIMGRFVNGASAPISEPFPISDSEELSLEWLPDVTYDSERDRFFVVWESTDFPDEVPARGLVSTSSLIRGATVTPAGQVSPSVVLTPEQEGLHEPATAYGSTTDEFLVTYSDNNSDVHVQRVRAGDLVLNGPAKNIVADEFGPIYDKGVFPSTDVAHDPVNGRWLVVFEAQQTVERGGGPEYFTEIYGTSIDGDLNTSPNRLISVEQFDFVPAREPSVAADTQSGGFLAVYTTYWIPPELLPDAARGKGKLDFPEEIYARPVGADGVPAGTSAHQVSDTNEEGDPEEGFTLLQNSRRPDVWHDPNADQYLVTWAQEVSRIFLARVDSSIQYEVFGKKVNTAGEPLEADTQISNHRPDDDSNQFDGDRPAVTYDRTVCDYVVAWTGEEVGENSNEKEEIWNRPYDAPACPSNPQQGATGTPAAGTAGSVVQASRTCTSRRNFTIRLVKRRDRKYEYALVKVNGQPVNVTYGDRVRAPVNLVGLPVGRFAVDIEARLANGKKLKGVRRYFTCNKKLPPSNGLDRPGAL